jgi:hypothetical protein
MGTSCQQDHVLRPGWPAAIAEGLLLYVYATEPYEGTTTSGLGIGVEMSCALGLAPVQEAYLTVSDGTLSASMLVFENVVVYDHDQDGRVYYLTVW